MNAFPALLTLCVASIIGQNINTDQITIGFLIEGSVNWVSVIELTSQLPDVSVHVALFPSRNQTLLYQAAERLTRRKSDIIVGYADYTNVHYIYRLFDRDNNEIQTGSELLPVDGRYWYLSTQDGASSKYSSNQSAQLIVGACSGKTQAAEALGKIVYQVAWTHLSILYHPTYVSLSSSLINILSDEGVGVYSYAVSAKADVDMALRKSFGALAEKRLNYILLGDRDFTESALTVLSTFDKEMNTGNAMSSFSRWILWGENIKPSRLREKIGSVNNIAILQAVPRCGSELSSIPTEHLAGKVLQTAETALQKDLSDLSNLQGFTKAQAVSTIFRSIEKVVSCHSCQNEPKFTILTAMWKARGRQFEPVMLATPTQGINASEESVFPNIKNGLNNITLTVTTMVWPPFTIKTIVGDKVMYEGFCLDLVLELASKLNFSFRITESPDKEWGRILDGEWTGLVGQMSRREADLVVAPLSIQPEREEVMDFITPFYVDYNVILLKKPDENSSKWRTLVDPFHWLVIVLIIISLPITTLFLSLCERISPCYTEMKNRELHPGLHNYSDCFWYLLGALLTQGGIYLPKSQSSRTITSFWWLFSIIMVATYSGNLIASLTVNRDLVPFNSVEQMVHQSTYKWGITNGSYLNMLLQTSKDPFYQKIWAGIQRFERKDPDVLNVDHRLQIGKVKAGKYAYINDASSFHKDLLEDCSLALVDEQFLPLRFAVGLQKDSPYKSIFDNQMMAISESGLLNLWKRKWWHRNSTCVGLLLRQAKPISIYDVQSAYYLLLLGIIVAGLVTLAERLMKIFRNRKKAI